MSAVMAGVLIVAGVAVVAGLVEANIKARREAREMSDEEILESDAEEQVW